MPRVPHWGVLARGPQGAQGLSGKQGVENAIYVEAVAEGDYKARKYVIDWKTPAQWVNGNRERNYLFPAKFRCLAPAGAPEEAVQA